MFTQEPDSTDINHQAYKRTFFLSNIRIITAIVKR